MRERRQNEIIHIYVSSVFIHVYGDDAMQQFLISLSNAEISCFAPLKTMKGGKFVPSLYLLGKSKHKFFHVQLFLKSQSFYLCHPLL